MRHAHALMRHARMRRCFAPIAMLTVGLFTLTVGPLAHAAPIPSPSPSPTAAPSPTTMPTGTPGVPTAAPTSDPATPAPTPTTSPTQTTLEAALARDLGLDRAGFIAAAQRAALAADLTDELQQVAGFNDVRLLGDQVTVTGQGDTLRQAAGRIDPAVPVIDQTPHPALGEIYRAWAAEVGPAGLQSIAHTETGVTITIAATKSAPKSPRQAAPADDPGITTAEEFVAARPWATLQHSTAPIESESVVGAGNGIYLAGAEGDPTWCTAGFAAQTADAAPALLTAGHCTHDGANTIIKSKPADASDDAVPTDDLGILDFHQFGGPGNQPDDGLSDPGTDLALIALANQHTATTDLPTGGPAAHITGTIDPTLGAPVCTFNRKTGWQCGTIDAPAVVYQTPGYTGPADLRTVASFSFTNPTGALTSVGGDSGAPVISGDKAVGILTASSHTPTGTPVIYSVPANALAGTAPNTRLQTWVPQPVLTGAMQATTTDATAAWQPGQSITGTIAASQGASNAGLTVDISIDNTPATALTTDQTGQFTFTYPATLAPPPARHTITITAHRGPDQSTPLTVFTPHQVAGANATVWATGGASSGALGVPTSDEYCDLQTNNGCFQHFTSGSIYRSANTPATAITGDFKEKFAALGWETSPLGYPNGPKTCGLVRGGCFQPFENGALYWSPSTGVHYSVGSIRNKYGDTGWEHGFLGYPTTDEQCGKRDNGCVQDFEYGNIMFSPIVGAHYIRGAILTRYSQLAYEFGPLAYPTTDEICTQPNGQPLRFSGCFQNFQTDNGSIYWTPQYGAHDIAGLTKATWAQTGYENGKLGYPTTDKACNGRDGGCFQNFDIDNATIYHQPNANSAHYIRGTIKAKWASIGYEHGVLGYPVTDEICDLPYQGCRQEFEREQGKITWQTSVGAHYLRGQIRTKWDQTTATNFDALSYPTTDETCGLKNGGCRQEFGKSTNATYPRGIWWSPNTGPHPVIAAGILNEYRNRGAENSNLGYPLNDTGTNSTNKYTQQFQGGWLETTQY